jgi:hypothetical protein
MIEEYVAAGISKFVIRPATALQTTASFADHVARELMPLQT